MEKWRKADLPTDLIGKRAGNWKGVFQQSPNASLSQVDGICVSALEEGVTLIRALSRDSHEWRWIKRNSSEADDLILTEIGLRSRRSNAGEMVQKLFKTGVY
jgi:hypothetical protein